MIGERAYQYALERRHKLREELDEIDRFIAVCEHYATFGEPDRTPANVAMSSPVETATPASQSESAAAPTQGEKRQRRTRSPIKDDDLHAHLRAILLDRGAPVSRQELIASLAARGVHPESKEPTNWLGTRLWRRRESYVQIPGKGYWLADVPNAAIGYIPQVGSVVPVSSIEKVDELFG